MERTILVWIFISLAVIVVVMWCVKFAKPSHDTTTPTLLKQKKQRQYASGPVGIILSLYAIWYIVSILVNSLYPDQQQSVINITFAVLSIITSVMIVLKYKTALISFFIIHVAYVIILSYYGTDSNAFLKPVLACVVLSAALFYKTNGISGWSSFFNKKHSDS